MIWQWNGTLKIESVPENPYCKVAVVSEEEPMTRLVSQSWTLCTKHLRSILKAPLFKREEIALSWLSYNLTCPWASQAPSPPPYHHSGPSFPTGIHAVIASPNISVPHGGDCWVSAVPCTVFKCHLGRKVQNPPSLKCFKLMSWWRVLIYATKSLVWSASKILENINFSSCLLFSQ